MSSRSPRHFEYDGLAVKVRVFLSCAPQDVPHREALVQQLEPLRRASKLKLWHDGQLTAGEIRDAVARVELDAAGLVLILMSPSYLSSDACVAEMERAIERMRAGRARVVPVRVRPCLDTLDSIANLRALPANGVPVTRWADQDQDQAWLEVAQEIAKVIEIIATTPPPAEDASRATETAEDASRAIEIAARVLDPGTSSSPPTQKNPGTLLHARHAIVPFYEPGRAKLLADIAAWCADTKRMVSARLITGAGGMGKTRLMIESTKRHRAQGWLAGFFRRDADLEGYQALLDANHPALIVIDYAESRTGLLTLLRWVTGRRATRKAPLRVMLLARAIGDWWLDVCARDQDVGEMLSEHNEVEVPPLAEDAASRDVVFQEAAQAFANHLNKDVPRDVPPLEAEVFERALYVHMAALMAVEGQSTAADRLMDNVLDHEQRFWLPENTATRRDTPHDEQANLDDTRRAVTALTLRGGASSREETNSLVARVGAGRNDARTAMLHALYPGEKSTSAQGLYVTGLEPDLLGEQMTLRTLRRERSDAARYLDLVLEEAAEKQVETAFEVLGRISAEHPDETRLWIRSVLVGKVSSRAMPALRAANSIGRRTAHALVGKELALALEKEGTPELAKAIEQALPEVTVSLRELRLWTAQKQLDALPTGEDEKVLEERARHLNNLGNRQSALGQREAALLSTREATDTYRKLSKERPDAFLPNLATSLNNLGAMQSALGQREAALSSTQEAVEIRRKLSKERPDAFLPYLARSLINLGARQSEQGQREAALLSTEEAVETYRKLSKERPDAFLPDLAMSLNNLGIWQSALGQREAALSSTQEAVEIRRKLSKERPDAVLPDLAMSLNNLGNRQSALGQREAALSSTQEAVEIGRKLSKERPDAFLPDLAMSLYNLGLWHQALGQREAAQASMQEAVDLYRPLAAQWPDVFQSDLDDSREALQWIQNTPTPS